MKKYSYIPFYEITLTDGFWKERQKLNAKVSIPSVYDRFDETDRFDCILPVWKRPFAHSHVFYDSDTAKWIEAAAYVLRMHRDEYPELEKKCDEIIARFAARQNSRGYVNSFYQRHPYVKKFFFRPNHELYCAGHIFEAAIAYFQATGKDTLLKVSEKYADYIRKRFMIKKNASFSTPGHEEIELALFRLYEATGKEKYKEMAEFFINTRGTVKERTYRMFTDAYDQHEKPVRELDAAEGHAVRAMYLFCAMADMARIDGDEKMFSACRRLFDDACKKMYVTGGIGSDPMGECFTVPYDLPNRTAYSESCAAISFLMFARRMLLLKNDVRYADVVERIMYNNLLSSTSLDGKAFFYENPLEIRQAELTRSRTVKKKPRFPVWERQEVFSCSCCPPNINRIVASIGDVIFTESEDAVIVQQYVACKTDFLQVETAYPVKGEVSIVADGYKKKNLILRIPSWCKKYTLSVDGEEKNYVCEDGYVTVPASENFSVRLTLDMTPYYVRCNPLCQEDIGKVALMRGPVVYCLEQADNGDLDAVAVSGKEVFSETESPLSPLPFLDAEGMELSSEDTYCRSDYDRKERKLRFTPYYTFANRGVSDMKVWVRKI